MLSLHRRAVKDDLAGCFFLPAIFPTQEVYFVNSILLNVQYPVINPISAHPMTTLLFLLVTHSAPLIMAFIRYPLLQSLPYGVV